MTNSEFISFYLKVDKEIMAGVDIPSKEAKLIPSVSVPGNISIGMEKEHPLSVITGEDTAIIFLDTDRNIETGEKLIFKAPLFADCTGDGTIGALAGAEFMQGRESRDVFGEQTAPERSDSLTMGASVQWFSQKRDMPVPFPDIKWGIELDDKLHLFRYQGLGLCRHCVRHEHGF